MAKLTKGIIKINPFKFHPTVVIENGSKSYDIEVYPKQQLEAFDNIGKTVLFNLVSKDYAKIKKYVYNSIQ